MKPLAKLLLPVVFAIFAMLFWQGHRQAGSVNPVATVVVPPAAPGESRGFVSVPGPSDDGSATVNQSALSSVRPASFEDTMALIHSKLHQWLEAKKNGTEEDETHTMLELEAMLSDTNAADIMQSLSAEELDTPFGFEGIRHWMNADPVQASNWFAARPETTQDQTAAVAQGWASDSAGLQNYVVQLPDTTWKQSFLQEAGAQMSVRDPAEAVKLAQEMDPGKSQTCFLQSVACNWVASDPNAALDWINNVSDPSLKEQLVASAAQSYALTDPAQAMTWLASSVQSDQIVKDSALNIIQTWVTKDPAGAANLVAQLPDGDTKQAALDFVSKYWEQTDPSAANAWIQGLSVLRNGSPGTSAGL